MGEINYKKLIAAANAIDRGMVEKDTKGEYAGHIKRLGDFFYDTTDIRKTKKENYSSYELDMFNKYDKYNAKTFYVDGSIIVSCYDNRYFKYNGVECNEEERIGDICKLAYKDAEALIVSLTENVYDNLDVIGKVLCAYHCDSKVKMRSEIAFDAFSFRNCSVEFENNKYLSIKNAQSVSLKGSISDGGYLHLAGVDKSYIIFNSIGKNLEKCRLFNLNVCTVIIKNLNNPVDISACNNVIVYTDKPELVTLSECSGCKVEDLNFKLSKNAIPFREYPINKKTTEDIKEIVFATYDAFIFSMTKKCNDILGFSMSGDLLEYSPFRFFSMMTQIIHKRGGIVDVSINNNIEMMLTNLDIDECHDTDISLYNIIDLKYPKENSELNRRMQAIKTLNLPAYTVDDKYTVVVMREAFNVGNKVDIAQLFKKTYKTYGIKFRWLVASYSFILDDLYVTDVLFLYSVTMANNHSIKCIDTRYAELNTIEKTTVCARIADNGHFLIRKGSELTVNIVDSDNIGRLEIRESSNCTFIACNCNLGEAKFVECSQCMIKLKDCRGTISFKDCSNIVVVNNDEIIVDACNNSVVHIG